MDITSTSHRRSSPNPPARWDLEFFFALLLVPSLSSAARNGIRTRSKTPALLSPLPPALPEASQLFVRSSQFSCAFPLLPAVNMSQSESRNGAEDLFSLDTSLHLFVLVGLELVVSLSLPPFAFRSLLCRRPAHHLITSTSLTALHAADAWQR